MVTVLVLLYVLVVVVAGSALLGLFLGTARKRPIRVSRELMGELVRWALLIIVIAVVFSGIAYLLVMLGGGCEAMQ
ncbi:MAG: hypothetical protein R3D52_07815 [Xanthobacteraceae bacterium]